MTRFHGRQGTKWVPLFNVVVQMRRWLCGHDEGRLRERGTFHRTSFNASRCVLMPFSTVAACGIGDIFKGVDLSKRCFETTRTKLVLFILFNSFYAVQFIIGFILFPTTFIRFKRNF